MGQESRHPLELNYPDCPQEGRACLSYRGLVYEFSGEFGSEESLAEFAEWQAIFAENWEKGNASPPSLEIVRARLLLQRSGFSFSSPTTATSPWTDLLFAVALAVVAIVAVGVLVMNRQRRAGNIADQQRWDGTTVTDTSAPASSRNETPAPISDEKKIVANNHPSSSGPSENAQAAGSESAPMMTAGARTARLTRKLTTMSPDERRIFTDVVRREGHLAALQYLENLIEAEELSEPATQ